MDLTELTTVNPFGAPAYFVEETDSTMTLARYLAKEGAPDGTVVCAGYQSSGRGRVEGRLWQAAPGENLLCTVLLRRAPVRGFTLRAGLAVAKTFARLLPPELEPRIKWPNDVLVSRRKVAGILCEGSGGVLYVGTGFNLAQRSFPPDLQAKAASLATLLPETKVPSPGEVLPIYLEELRRALEDELWHERVSELLLYRGERIRFLQGDPERGEWIDGTVEGIGEEGELLFRPAPDADAYGPAPACCAGTLRLFSGEIPYPAP